MPKLLNLPKRKPGADMTWGSKGKDARLLVKFRRLFSRMDSGALGIGVIHGTEDGAAESCLTRNVLRLGLRHGQSSDPILKKFLVFRLDGCEGDSHADV